MAYADPPIHFTDKRFIVIRRNSFTNKLFYDWHTMSKGPLASQTSADRWDRITPDYSENYPQVECVRVIITVDPTRAKGVRRKKV